MKQIKESNLSFDLAWIICLSPLWRYILSNGEQSFYINVLRSSYELIIIVYEMFHKEHSFEEHSSVRSYIANDNSYFICAFPLKITFEL